MKIKSFVFICLLTSNVFAIQNIATVKPMEITEAIDVKSFSDLVPMRLSPDGRFISYTLRDSTIGNPISFFSKTGTPTDMVGSSVYVANVKTGEAIKLVQQEANSWGGSWSPNGKMLAFYSDHESNSKVWIWDSRSKLIFKLSDEAVAPFWGFEQIQWSPDSQNILVKLMPEEENFRKLKNFSMTNDGSSDSKTDAIQVLEHNPEIETEARKDVKSSEVNLDNTPSSLNIELGDLATINVKTRQIKRIKKNARFLSYLYSHDGNSVVYTARPSAYRKNELFPYDKYDLWIVDKEHKSKKIASQVIQDFGLGFSWSPDNKKLAYTSEDKLHIYSIQKNKVIQTFYSNELSLSSSFRRPIWINNNHLICISKNSLWGLSIASGKITKILTSDSDRFVDFVASSNTQKLNSTSLLIQTVDRQTKEVGFKKVNLRTKELTQVFKKKMALGTDPAFHLDMAKDYSSAVFISENASEPQSIWVTTNNFTKYKRVTRIQKTQPNIKLGKSLLVEWEDSQGRNLKGALLLPSNYEEGKKYPLFIKIYGGSYASHKVNRFGFEPGIDNLQLLATRGYAVFFPDCPLKVGTPMKDIADVVVSGTKKIISMGIADPDRIGIYGHSYGGYSALSVAVQSRMFKTIICSASQSNLFSNYTDMLKDGNIPHIHWAEKGQGRMGGHPWEYKERYIENSPFFFLDNVNASILLIHGGEDSVVFPERAKETFVGLKRLNKKVKLVLYTNEEHHQETWSKKNKIHFLNTVFDWLEKNL